MPTDEAQLDRFGDRRAVVEKADAAVARARIVDARHVVAIRQLDERDVLAQRHRFGIGVTLPTRAREQSRRRSRTTAAAPTAAPPGRSAADPVRARRRHHRRRRSPR